MTTTRKFNPLANFRPDYPVYVTVSLRTPGGMEYPGFQTTLADVEAGKVNRSSVEATFSADFPDWLFYEVSFCQGPFQWNDPCPYRRAA